MITSRIEELKLDAIRGEIPTWYAYEEIDRLENLRLEIVKAYKILTLEEVSEKYCISGAEIINIIHYEKIGKHLETIK